MVLEEKEILDKDEKIVLMNDEINKLANEIEQKDNLIKLLNEGIGNLLNKIKNDSFKEEISDLEKLLKKTKEEINKLKKEVNFSEVDNEKNYLKGKFTQFIKEKSALEILVNGMKFYYPLSCYQNEYLPISGARVLIFKTLDNKSLIFGFDFAKMIPLANRYCGEIKFFSKSQKRLKLFIEKIGYVNFAPDENFFKNSFKIGDKIILKEIIIEAKSCFLIEKENYNENFERKEILKIIKDRKD